MQDLPAYLHRIGFKEMPRVDLTTLKQMVHCQALAIPFENLDAFTGRAVSLVPADVEAKLVHGRRGGWCFEHNLLLGNALRAVGFPVTDLAGRVLWGLTVSDFPARTHRLLRVECGGRHYLLDAGFGVLTPPAPLDFSVRGPQATPHERFRLRELDADLLLEAELSDAVGSTYWAPLYRFDLHPQWPIDFEAPNYQLARDPASQFVAGLRVAQPRPDGRYTLRDRELTWRDRAGSVESRRLADAIELRTVLREIFGIDESGITGLDERFARLG
ncbi:MAG: arylamine N-acetyltransferase [Steroidobacteraceae bacterium]